MSEEMLGTRPLTATVGAVLSIIGTLLIVSFLLFGLSFPREPPLSDEEVAWLSFAFVYMLFNGFFGLGGAFYIFRRRYRLGGVLALVCGISIGIMILGGLKWLAVAILPIIGGVLALVSKDKIVSEVLGVAKLHGRIKISDLAAKVGKTEADVELSITDLQSRGEPITFEAETREIIYKSSKEE